MRRAQTWAVAVCGFALLPSPEFAFNFSGSLRCLRLITRQGHVIYGVVTRASSFMGRTERAALFCPPLAVADAVVNVAVVIVT